MRESMVFYRSFYEALHELPPDVFKEVMCAILEYALYETEPKNLVGMANMAFLLIKPQIDANNKRYKNGAKGGRPKKIIDSEIEKPMVIENKTNGYETEKPNDNVNDNANVNANDNKKENKKEKEEFPEKKPVKHKHGEYNNVLLTDDELQKLKTEYSDYQERIERLSSYIASTGKKYKSHYATIRNWARKDTDKVQKKGTVNEYENIARNAGLWI